MGARFATHVVATTVILLLLFATIDFIAAERQVSTTLVYGLPVWVAELPLPVGYALIAMHSLQQATPNTAGRLVAAAVVVIIVVWLKIFLPDAALITVPALIVLGVATLLGAPIFVAIGGAALFLLLGQGVPAASIAVDHYSLVNNPSLSAIPMFALAGYLLAESSAPRRLIAAFGAIFGHLRGGAVIATVLACTFFTSFTGASGVTVLALGGLAMPLLLASGYSSKRALGLVTAAGLPGTLLMPALPLILYAIVAGISIKDMFLGGMLPTLLLVGILATWGIMHQPVRRGVQAPFEWGKVRDALVAAKWELSVPIVPIISLSTGFATPVEAAALTALYVFFLTVFVHHDLRLANDVPRVITECGLIIGGIMLIMGVALGLTDFLVDAQIPDHMVTWVTHTIRSQFIFLLVLNASLLIAGCVIEIYPAIMILAPIVTRIGQAYGLDPVHLGIIFLANMELGYLTPLVGLNLFYASYRFGKPIIQIFRAVAPLFLWLGVGVLVITYIPWFSTGLFTLLH